MNAWFERLRAAARDELGDDVDALQLTGEEARLLLDLARDVAHGSGARQYAPLATFLAGRVAGASGRDVAAVAAALTKAAEAAGQAGEESADRR
jgi:hypothetical protein